MATRDFTNTRYSPLSQIDARTVGRLRQIWSFETGLRRGHEAAPIVAMNKMFVVLPYPNTVLAFDLERPGPALAWRYEPKPERAAQGVACCDVVNRGAVFANGRLFFNTLDNHTIALDAASGEELWNTKLGDIGKGETVTMAPAVVKGHVLVGNSGGELGVRGWLTALDAETGRIAWRAYSTGPDTDVLIDAAFRPFYPQDRGKDLGVTSWPPGKWQVGGGTVWGFLSYDPELDHVYYGTGNPGPWNPELRAGANLWTAGMFARRPEDGRAVWFYQWSPHDLYDHDGVNEAMLVDLERDGTRRKLLLHPGRTGYFYVLDRETGQVLAADPFVRITTSERVDLHTGRLIPTPGKEPGFGRTVRDICPASPGGQGLAALVVLRDHRPRLHGGEQPVSGPGGLGGELHRRHPVPRRERQDVRGARRVSG